MSSPKLHTQNIYTVYHDKEDNNASTKEINKNTSDDGVLNSAIAEDFKLELEYKNHA